MESQKTSLILGGTKGLGRHLADLSSGAGERVIEVGSSVITEVLDGSRLQLHCDLRDLGDTMRFISRISQFQPIHRFFWVAGKRLKGSFVNQSSDEIRFVTNINYGHSVLVAKSVWWHMEHSQPNVEHSFVVIGSSSGVNARKEEAVYAGSKHAQVGFTRSLGLENQNPLIRITLALPGGMKTEFWDGDQPADFDQFLDPAKVAPRIWEAVNEQSEMYQELPIPRGSL